MGDDRNGPGFIYLIGRNDGWFKIGRTADLEERFRSIRWQYGRGKELVLLALVEVSDQARVERAIHRVFASKRVDRCNTPMGTPCEMFRLDKRDLGVFVAWAKELGDRVIYTDVCLTSNDWLAQLREVIDGI